MTGRWTGRFAIAALGLLAGRDAAVGERAESRPDRVRPLIAVSHRRAAVAGCRSADAAVAAIVPACRRRSRLRRDARAAARRDIAGRRAPASGRWRLPPGSPPRWSSRGSPRIEPRQQAAAPHPRRRDPAPVRGRSSFYLWEVAVRGFGVPSVLMPAPSAIATRFAASLPMLGEDFVQTFVRGVLVRLRHRLRSRLRGRRARASLRIPRPRAAAARQFRLRAADRRHRADHGDVVRLRLALEGGGGRGHHVLPDAGEHARGPRRRRATSSAT